MLKSIGLNFFPYIFTIALLTYKFGAVGATIAWSLRVTLDTIIIVWLSVKMVGVPTNIFSGNGIMFSISSLILILPILFVVLISNYSYMLLFLTSICFLFYFFKMWKNFFESEEKILLTNKFYGIFNR